MTSVSHSCPTRRERGQVDGTPSWSNRPIMSAALRWGVKQQRAASLSTAVDVQSPLGHRERLKRLSRAGYRSSRVRLTRHPRSKKKTRYYPGRWHDGKKKACKRVGDQGTQAAPESGHAKLVVLTQSWGDRSRATQRRAASVNCSNHTSADVLVRDR